MPENRARPNPGTSRRLQTWRNFLWVPYETHLAVADVGQLELALVLVLSDARIVQVHVPAQTACRQPAAHGRHKSLLAIFQPFNFRGYLIRSLTTSAVALLG